MADTLNSFEEVTHKDEKLIKIWGRRNPKFEKKYEESVIKVLAEFGKKANETTTAKGKIFGNGYEPYIIAFFIGLYSNKKLPLSDDTRDLRWPLENWGNVEARNLRKPYSDLRSYIFMALVAKSDIDWIALEKGEMEPSAAVSILIKTMEEYANYGFSFMEEKLQADKGYFFSHRAFLDIFLQLTDKSQVDADSEEEPEDL